MPEICRFFGIIITMFHNDHNPPHFHARYGNHKIAISIPDFSILSGYLPPRVFWICYGMGISSQGRIVTKLGSGKERKTFNEN